MLMLMLIWVYRVRKCKWGFRGPQSGMSDKGGNVKWSRIDRPSTPRHRMYMYIYTVSISSTYSSTPKCLLKSKTNPLYNHVQTVAGLMSGETCSQCGHIDWLKGGKSGEWLVADGKCQGCRRKASPLCRPAELYGVTALVQSKPS